MRRLGANPSAFFDGWSDQNDATPAGHDKPVPATPRRSRSRLVAGVAALAVGAAATATAFTFGGSSALADPSAHTWNRLRTCESSDNYRTNTGNGYYGAYQFDLSTWRSVGGTGYPNQASPAEQDYRALILYRERGWQPWTCASILGLKDDSDAGSGHIGDIPKPGSGGGGGSTGSGGIPAFPGSHWYYVGDNNTDIKRFQNEMHHRGFFPAGTGQYGPLTLHMVKRLQRLNGLPVTGYIGPNTWRLAWTGKYATTAKRHHPIKHKPIKHKPVKHHPVKHHPVKHHPVKHHPVRVPKFPGTSNWRTWYYIGARNAHVRQFQNELHHRGILAKVTGRYGPLTLRIVKKLQRANGLDDTGAIGPNTWRLAWTGKYPK